MKVTFHEKARKDYIWWTKEDMKTFDRINKLIDAITRNPFRGIGDPEPLKHKLNGSWSRRIDNKNRLIYRIKDNDSIEIVRCKGHYED